MDTKPPKEPVEPMVVRVFQSLILLTGVGFLVWVFLPLPWPQLIIGVVVLVSTIPPLSTRVNIWLTGSPTHMQMTIARLSMGGMLVVINLIKVLV